VVVPCWLLECNSRAIDDIIYTLSCMLKLYCHETHGTGFTYGESDAGPSHKVDLEIDALDESKKMM